MCFLKSSCLTIYMIRPIPAQEMACVFSLSSNLVDVGRMAGD